jgi:hypothetical protein
MFGTPAFGPHRTFGAVFASDGVAATPEESGASVEALPAAPTATGPLSVDAAAPIMTTRDNRWSEKSPGVVGHTHVSNAFSGYKGQLLKATENHGRRRQVTTKE